jgi:hypothetical protein
LTKEFGLVYRAAVRLLFRSDPETASFVRPAALDVRFESSPWHIERFACGSNHSPALMLREIYNFWMNTI